jgi:hypothetical protein
MPRRSRCLLLAAVLLGTAGCETKQPTQPVDTPPSAASPAGALRVLEWAWNHRDLERYAALLPEEFTFASLSGDSAGNPYRATPWLRAHELAAIDHLFHGGNPSHPAVTEVSLAFDDLHVMADPRPGKSPRWHKSVRARMVLDLALDGGGGISLTSDPWFFVVRGDSATVPEDLLDQGVVPDSTHWYLERWEEPTGDLLELKTRFW